jgi:hypothetical protein
MRYLLFVFLLLSFFLSYSQTEIMGIPWEAGMGVKISVKKLMSQKDAQKTPSKKLVKEHEIHLKKQKNPDAPEVSSFPFDSLKSDEPYMTPRATQSIGASWAGPNLGSSGFIPPDSNGDVGPTQVFVAANGRFRVYDKSGVLGPLDITADAFFNSVRNNSTISDPHVRYDRLSRRWFVCAINTSSTNNRFVLAVSDSSIITGSGSFTFFFFNQQDPPPAGDAGKFLDYPTMGVDANALYIGGVRFNPTVFDGCPVFVIRKSSVLGAGPMVVTAFRTISSATAGTYVPQGVHNDDPTATEGYFIGTDAAVFSRLNVTRVSNPGGTPSVTNFQVTVPANTFPLLQRHLGAAANRRLDALDDRLFAAQIMKNKITGTSSLWTAHATAVNNTGVAAATLSRNASRWYEIGTLSTTPTLLQSGTLFDNAATNPRGFWIPSIAMSGQGHAVLGCSTAGINNYADVAVAGRYNTSPLGTLDAFVNATNSTTAYNVQAVDGQRWGDYSQVVVDPTDDMTMWTFQEYCNATNSWAVRAIKLDAPPPPPSAAIDAIPFVGCGASFNINVTASSLPSNSGFFDPGNDVGGPGYANRLTASISGGITVNSITFNSPSSVTISANTLSAAAGTKVITITNPDGQSTTKSFNFGGCVPLPVQLVHFNVKPFENKDVICEWTTQSELNNKEFIIERSSDAIHYEVLGTISGAGNSNQILNYQFTDEKVPLNQDLYYKLSQIDYDGTLQYLDIKSAKIERLNNDIFEVFPNPNYGTVYVKCNECKYFKAIAEIYDPAGRLVYKKEINDADFSITPAEKLSGQHILRIYNSTTEQDFKLIFK